MNQKTVKLMELSVILCGVVVFASMVATLFYTRHLNGERRAEQIAGCERANQQRRYINRLVSVTGVDLKPIVIPVCAEIIK